MMTTRSATQKGLEMSFFFKTVTFNNDILKYNLTEREFKVYD